MPSDLDARKTKAQELAENLFKYATAGDVAAAKVLLDRIDGPVRTELSGPGGTAITIDVLRDALRDAYPDR